MITFGKTKFLVLINYKSGNSVQVWMTKFTFKIAAAGRTVEWEPVTPNGKPLFINVDEIESVWQIGYRLNIFEWLLSFVRNT